MKIKNKTIRLVGFQGSRLSLVPGEEKFVDGELAALLLSDRIFLHMMEIGEIAVSKEKAPESAPAPVAAQAEPDQPEAQTEPDLPAKKKRGRPFKVKPTDTEGPSHDGDADTVQG